MKKILTFILIAMIALQIPCFATTITTKYKIEYKSKEDPTYGKPDDENLPEIEWVSKDERYILKDTPKSKSKTAINKNTGKTEKGRWKFSTYWKDRTLYGLNTLSARIQKDRVFYGEWTFVTKEYLTVTYKTITKIPYELPDDLIIPASETVPFGSNYTLKRCPTTKATTAIDSDTHQKIQGKWFISDFWYKDIALTKRAIVLNNIKEDTTVYIKCKFVPANTKFTVTYHTLEDPIYGVPEDAFTPEPEIDIPVDSKVTLIKSVTDMDSKQRYATNKLTGEQEFGIWIFSPIWHDKNIKGNKIFRYYNIDENKNVYGRWYFYTL